MAAALRRVAGMDEKPLGIVSFVRRLSVARAWAGLTGVADPLDPGRGAEATASRSSSMFTSSLSLNEKKELFDKLSLSWAVTAMRKVVNARRINILGIPIFSSDEYKPFAGWGLPVAILLLC